LTEETWRIPVSARSEISRRHFVQQAASGLAAAASAPLVVSPQALGQAQKPPPSDRVVVGLIGAGDFGRRQHLGRLLLPNKRVQVAAVCDVDQFHREKAAQDVLSRSGKRVSIHKDFRDLLERNDLDAVVIAVPDHWHALVAIAAMQAGKDVYCEKPLTLTIEQGQAMVATARRYGSVFQTGSQQRSDQHYFRQAHELVRKGAIGQLQKVAIHIGGSSKGTWQPAQTPPPNLDWNAWLGPAPYADYSPNRCHYSFRWFSDYSGGSVTDHGAHHSDIAQWIIGADGSGPTKVEGTGTFHPTGPNDVAASFQLTFTYGRHAGVQLVFTSEKSPRGGNLELYGTRGWISVSRRRILAEHPEILRSDPEPHDYQARLLESYTRHYDNWLDSIQSRQRPACDVEIGHRSVTVCHLANIALRLGRPLNWDPTLEEFVDDAPANRLLSRPMRGPWHL
jgi:predicted dehydrogenase